MREGTTAAGEPETVHPWPVVALLPVVVPLPVVQLPVVPLPVVQLPAAPELVALGAVGQVEERRASPADVAVLAVDPVVVPRSPEAAGPDSDRPLVVRRSLQPDPQLGAR